MIGFLTILAIAAVGFTIWFRRKRDNDVPVRFLPRQEAARPDVERHLRTLEGCEREADNIPLTVRRPSEAKALILDIDRRASESAEAALADIGRLSNVRDVDTNELRSMSVNVRRIVRGLSAKLERFDAVVSRTTDADWEPSAEEPWRGRQYSMFSDIEDPPDSAPTWHAVFNRQVVQELAFEIDYADSDGVVTTRAIEPKSIHLVRNEAWIYIRAHCSLRGDVRVFKSDRIVRAKNLKTKRAIRDLGQFLRGRI